MVSALGDLGDKMSQVEQGSVDEAHLLVPWHKISCGKGRTAGDSERLTVGLQDGSPAVHVLRDQQGPQKLPHLGNLFTSPSPKSETCRLLLTNWRLPVPLQCS